MKSEYNNSVRKAPAARGQEAAGWAVAQRRADDRRRPHLSRGLLYWPVTYRMAGIVEDLRYGLRALAKNRGFAVIAILSLGLGIGANTIIFTLINAILLRPLPVEAPARLAAVFTLDPRNPGLLYSSYPNYKDYRERNQVFSSLLIYTGVALNLTGGDEPKLIMGQIVSANYFSTLGLEPALGRWFLPEEDSTPGANPVAVIGHRFWQRDFGGDPRVTSRTLSLNGRPYNVVGVAPPGFEGFDTLTATEIWVPFMMYQQVYPNAAWVNQRRALLFSVVGRLKPGMSLQQAESGLQNTAKDLEREYPKDNEGRRIKLTTLSDAALPAKNREVINKAGTVLLIISGLVLLIGCGNVASLLLARATARGKEIAVRLAMGASRWRLVRQLLTESMVLAVVGGAAGLALARWVLDVIWSIRPPMFNHAAIRPDLNGRVLVYNLAVSLLTGVLFGLAPALRATRSDLSKDLKERTGRSGPSGGSWRPRSVLVSGQVALSVMALLGAGLFVRSLLHANRFDPGFDAAHLGIVVFNVADQGYDQARGRDFQQQALDRAAAVPGVVSATLARDWPFEVSLARTIMIEGQETGRGRVTLMGVVRPGYFRTVGIPLLRGRDFSPLDHQTAPRVAIVNEAAAKAFWPGENAVGKRLRYFGDNLPAEVIGVARNANYQTLGEQPQALIYVSLIQYYFPFTTLYVRTAGEPDVVLGSVRAEVQALDHNLLLQSETVHRTMNDSLWAQRFSAGLLTMFGGLALLLATVGIYGVISYAVNQRVREIGVRMALGASAGQVQTLILREGMRLVAIGVIAGIGIALGASRAVASMLFVIGPRDTLTFVAVPSILTMVAILACWVPARRATRVDPATALRDE